MFRHALLVLLALLAVASAACDDDSGGQNAEPSPSNATTTREPAAGGSEGTAPAGSNGALSTADIAQKLTPSIVRVQTEIASVDPFGRAVPGIGVGSGFIIDVDGHIVTNNHVVTGPDGSVAQSISVTFSDQTTLPATVVGNDAPTDLAVLSVQRDGLTPATWAAPDSLVVGQDVVAIGFALGLEGAPTVTQGVLSAVNRTINEQPYTIPEALQTDASINPGNSGGPLVNRRGEVVGINTAIIQNAQGIGFAISGSLARPIVEELIASGGVDRAYVGIAGADVNPAIARNLQLPVDSGVVVEVVASGSPAEAAGLQRGDVIVSVDGEAIENNGDLLRLLADRQPGDNVTVSFYRNGEQREAQLTLGRRPAT
jgi:S1-C subfamily serine protease